MCAAAVLDMSMSLDGFIAGANDVPGNGLGDGGEVLHAWLWPEGTTSRGDILEQSSGIERQMVEEILATGAVLTGRRTFEMAGGWEGDHHDGVPIFILTGNPPAEPEPWPLVTYVSDIAEGMAAAKAGAGERNVLVHGALTAKAALAAGVLDEVQIHLVPVLLGRGRRLFEEGDLRHLEIIRVNESPRVTHLRYRVQQG